MFKVGDIVESVATTPGEFTKGWKYTVSSFSGVVVYVELDDSGNKNNGQSKSNWINLTAQTILTTPKTLFAKGLMVRCLVDYQGQFRKDRVYTVRDYYPPGNGSKIGIVAIEVDDTGSTRSGSNEIYWELAFKKGDTVEALGTAGTGIVKGNVYIVREYPDNNGRVCIEKDSDGIANGWTAQYFKVVSSVTLVNTTNAAITITLPQVSTKGLWFGISGHGVGGSKADPVCECGNKHAPIGQSHSTWCDLYKREFV